MKKETRKFLTDLECRNGELGVCIRGYAAVFDSDSEDLGGFIERIAPGAFDSVMDADVRGLFNHDYNQILGRSKAGTLRMSVDEKGLSYEIDLPDTQAGRDLAVSIKRGDVSESSFAFSVEKDHWENRDGRIVRTILEMHGLYDVSPVTVPAYPDTTVALCSLDEFKESEGAHVREIAKRKLFICKHSVEGLY